MFGVSLGGALTDRNHGCRPGCLAGTWGLAGKPPSSSPLLENPDRMVKSTCAKYHGKAVIKLLKKLNDNLPEDKLEQVRKYSVF